MEVRAAVDWTNLEMTMNWTARSLFNLGEGIFWIVIGAIFIIISCRRTSVMNSALALAFVAFGISDFVEIRTGAWWRPAWLLLWKAVCVVTLIAAFFHYLRRKSTKKSPPKNAPAHAQKPRC